MTGSPPHFLSWKRDDAALLDIRQTTKQFKVLTPQETHKESLLGSIVLAFCL